VSLEDPDRRSAAVHDPRAFLGALGTPAIIDEFQRAPELVSYLQTLVDEVGGAGLFVLTGSHSHRLHGQLAQSLAGRVGLLNLYPFSQHEMVEEPTLTGRSEAVPAKESPHSAQTPTGRQGVWERLFAGMFPRVVAGGVPPGVWYPSYIATCLEKDVREILAVRDLTQFQTFLRLVAHRTGQLVNLSSLASDAGISVPTARQWLSALEAGHLLVRVAPWFSNASKRLVKSPKLYLADTGLLCNLLGIYSSEELSRHALRGAVFENWVLLEALKAGLHAGQVPRIHFWRDRDGNEVDFLWESPWGQYALEAKSTATADSNVVRGFQHLRRHFDLRHKPCLCYAGDASYPIGDVLVLPWNEISGHLAGP